MMTNTRHKISYCVKCGLVDLTGKSGECDFCQNKMSLTEEYFDEICSTNNFDNKTEIEEYVRQTYVYFDEYYDEQLMEQRENILTNDNKAEYYENKFLQKLEAKCPTCGSIDIEKISASDKVVGGIAFGLFSSNVHKSFKCRNCGGTW